MQNNKPSQLERLRKEHYQKLYARKPQLMRKLIPLMKKADIIQRNIIKEPNPYSPKNPLSNLLKKSEPNKKKKVDRKKKLREDLNKFNNRKKQQNIKYSKVKKITDIRPEILWGLK